MPVDMVLIALEDRPELARFPALLRRAEASVTLLGNTGVAMGWSRFVDRKIPCGAEPLGIALAIRAIVHQSNSQPWLICCDDRALAALAQSRGQDWLDRMYPVDNRGPMVDAVFRKSAFTEAAKDCIPMAPSALCVTQDEAIAAARWMGFPIMLRRDIDGGGRNDIVVANAQDLATACDNLADIEPILVQKVIQGKSGTTDVLFHRGRPVCWSSGYAHGEGRAFDPQLDQMLCAVGNLTGFQGFAGIDWTQGASGSFLLTRFIGTPTPGLLLGQRNGVDFARALWELFHGMLRVQKPWAVETSPVREKLFPLTRLPWTDPGLLVRSVLDFARGR